MTSWLHAWRSLGRRPAFTSGAIATLAFGIAVTSALFSVVDTVLLRPLPFPSANQLVTIYEASPARRERVSLVAPVRLEEWNRFSHAFVALSGSYTENVTDTSGAEPERLAGRRVAPRYFEVFGMAPLAGRTFNASEEAYGGPKAAVIAEGLWTRRYGRSAEAVGRRLTIGGDGYTIVGVMPAAFTSAAVDVWLPAQFAVSSGPMRRDARFLSGVGRLKPGVTIEKARADLARVQDDLAAQYPSTDKGWSVTIGGLKDALVGDYRRALLLVFGAVLSLFLIAVANISGLMLVQLHRRSAELAIRSAIGGSRAQIIGAIMREVVSIAIAGAAAGWAAAIWIVDAVGSLFTRLPRSAELGLDWRALAFTAAASAGAAIAFGLVPALHATRDSIARAAAAGSRGAAGGRHRLQSTLVFAQIALSVLLAGSAGLLLRSYYELSRADTGFNAPGTLTFHVGAAWDEDRQKVGQFQQQFVAQLQQLPGVTAAGFTNFLPETGATLRYQVHIAGIGAPQPAGLTVGERTITSGYLRALQVPLIAGEWCPALTYDTNAPATALVNRRFVDTFALGQNLVGREGSFDFDAQHPWRIVGVIGDIVEDAPGTQPVPYVYMCLPAGSWPDPEYVVRAAGDPRSLASGIRQLVHRLAPARPVFSVKRVDDVISGTLDQPRLDSSLLAIFAAAATQLAALGLYGLLMLGVAERRRELGVRMALGASPADVVWLVVSAAGRMIAAGAVIGLVLAAIAGRAMGALLFTVRPLDFMALGGAVAALALVSLAAVAIPARRAALTNAIEAMKV
jgi:putative ABC transport system permease protein